MFTSEQVKGMSDRAATVFATMLLAWLVRRGWIGESDSATLLPAIVLLPSLAWGWWVNRNKALQQAAANTVDVNGKKPIIVTDAQTAAVTAEPNIVSSSDVRVVLPSGQPIVRPTA